MYRVGKAESRRPGAVHTSGLERFTRAESDNTASSSASSTAAAQRAPTVHVVHMEHGAQLVLAAGRRPHRGQDALRQIGKGGPGCLAWLASGQAVQRHHSGNAPAELAQQEAAQGSKKRAWGEQGEQSVGASAKHCMPGPRTTSSLKLMLSNMYASRLASGLMDSSGMARNSVEVMKPCTQAQAGHCRRWVGLQLAVPMHALCSGGGGSWTAHTPLGN